jgi:23S rRNA pseudouridine1911/1915/1917 synthase
MPSVALRHTDTQTVANFLIAQFPETAGAGPRPLEAGLVHRLDTDTSGLLLAARTPLAYATLREQFRRRLVKKQYLAIVEGILKREGQISHRLEPTGPRGQRMRVATVGQGQEALTHYIRLEHLLHHTVVRLTIKTGVRHQIRVHLAALGHPIVGDKIYGATDQHPARLCLHAETLTFCHPATGQDLSYTILPPKDFSAVLDQFRRESAPGNESVEEGRKEIARM